MTDDPVAAYARAREEFAYAEEELQRHVSTVHEIMARFAYSPRRFGFSGIEPRLPDDVLAQIRSRSLLDPAPHIVPAREWPTAAEIQQCIVAWHRARLAVQAAYRAIPRARRVAVVAPPEPYDYRR